METKERVYLAVKELGTATANTVGLSVGLSRSVYQNYLKQLVDEGRIYRRGNARRTVYSVDPDTSNETKPVKPSPLPPMPEIVLAWMGYTNIQPSALHARYVEFE